MNEWLDEWMNEWIDEWMNEWIDELRVMNECVNEWIDFFPLFAFLIPAFYSAN